MHRFSFCLSWPATVLNQTNEYILKRKRVLKMNKLFSSRDFFDTRLIDSLFGYLRNLLLCTIIIAAGYHGHLNPPDWVIDTWLVRSWGFPLMAIGTILILLNLIDYLYKTLEFKLSRSTLIIFFTIHLFISIRLLMMIVGFRTQ